MVQLISQCNHHGGTRAELSKLRSYKVCRLRKAFAFFKSYKINNEDYMIGSTWPEEPKVFPIQPFTVCRAQTQSNVQNCGCGQHQVKKVSSFYI